MSTFPAKVKAALQGVIADLVKFPKTFARNPSTDFTRNNGLLPMARLITIILGMSKGTISSELRDFFGSFAKAEDIPSASAFVQQRSKLLPDAFEWIFYEMNRRFSPHRQADDFYLVAVDGTETRFYGMPDETDYICHPGRGERDCHSIHTTALINMGSNRYIDAVLQPIHKKNEFRAFTDMIVRYPDDKASNTIFLADRGFASFNIFAHIIKKDACFLIRAKDITSKSFASRLSIPHDGEFDVTIPVNLIRRSTKQLRALPNATYLDKNAAFDYLDPGSDDVFSFNLRVIRFPLPSGEYELLMTNLPSRLFDTEAIKRLYFRRWGIETSFRGLKYNISLNYFHGKKSSFIQQEIWAALIMFNFCEVIASHIQLLDHNRKYTYQINRAELAKLCLPLLRLHPDDPFPDIDSLALKCLSPVRHGRNFPRNKRPHKPASFSYR